MSTALDKNNRQEQKSTRHYAVVVLGAGPYGLAVSAHLHGHGVNVATFGKAAYFWQNHMPTGMLLRSYWWASNLSDPKGTYSITRYFQMKGVEPPDPLPIETFIDYALWFQKNAVPNVDETYIKVIERTDDSSYRITLEDGRVVTSSAVVLAPGLQYYQYIPEFYAHLPQSLLSHTNEYKDLAGFTGKRVAMIGGGQAALECSALLNEQGAQVTVVVRRQLNWLSKADGGTSFASAIHAVRAPQAGMGDGWSNVILEKLPYLLHSTVKPWKNYVLGKMHGPAGSEWLMPRILGKVQVKEHANVVKAEAINDDTAVRLTLSTGEVLEVEHVILGTGFRPEVKSLPMLSQDIKDALRTYRGSPVLSSWFESSVPGMYFIGFSAARGFGPLYRFVIGSAAAARRTAAAAVRYAASVKSGAHS